MLRVTLAQINPTQADIEGNINMMYEAACQAQAEGSKLIVFPELSLTAYLPGDVLLDPYFLQKIDRGLSSLLTKSKTLPGLYWVLGAPLTHDGQGKKLHNSLLVIQQGNIVARYAKQLLPTYNIFDEHRYFDAGVESACVVSIDTVRVGFLICEDIWNDDGKHYPINPLSICVVQQPDLLVTINASPSHYGHMQKRLCIAKQVCQHYQLPLIYVNQIGGHDQIIYDGASFALQANGSLAHESPAFTEAVDTIDFDANTRSFLAHPIKSPSSHLIDLPRTAFYQQQIILGLRDYMLRNRFSKVIVGSSGGIDSALTLALAVEALGKANVEAITLPSQYSSSGSVSDSELLCKNLGIKLYCYPIRDLVIQFQQSYQTSMSQPLSGLALENLQARIRGTVLMAHSNACGGLLITTGNKSEMAVGYCTLYGDTNGGLGLIGDLYKTEIYELARFINERAGYALIPDAILQKAPSAELAFDQKDSDSLPEYPLLDEILKFLLEGENMQAQEKAHCEQTLHTLLATSDGQALIKKIRNLIIKSEYKRKQAAPQLRMRALAFGMGRQIPITTHPHTWD